MASLYPRGKGRIFWLYDYDQGRRIRRSLKTSDKRVADWALEHYLKAKRERKLPAGLRTIPLRVALVSYWHELRHRCRPQSAQQRLRCLLHLFRQDPPFQVTECTPERCSALLRAANQEAKWHPRTYNEYRNSLYGFLRWCLRQRWITQNPMDAVPPLKVPETVVQFLSTEELERLRQVAESHWTWPAVATAIGAGLRVAELRQLERSDVDFQANALIVRNKAHFTTKSGRIRVVPLSAWLRAILLTTLPNTGRCFGRPGRSIHSSWREFCHANHLPAHWTWRVFRSTFATHCALNGIPPVKLREWMGHKDLRITMRYYVGLQMGYDADIERFSYPGFHNNSHNKNLSP